MELWIRSQNRQGLTKVYDIQLDSFNVKKNKVLIINSRTSTDCVSLGEYDTIERALEVLDEIHQRLIDLQMLEYTIGDSDISWSHGKSLDCVYFMPKE